MYSSIFMPYRACTAHKLTSITAAK